MLTNLGLNIKKDIVKIWNSGWVWIDELRYKGSLDYITWCMSKDIDDERLMGKKAYFTSRNLVRK
jgi:signal transduction histidine kinase